MNARKTFTLFISGLLILLFSATTWAKDPIRRRQYNPQYNQRYRIKNGLENGSITKHEFSKLKKEQQRIQKFTHNAARDGRITPKERRAIVQMRDRAGRHISRAKENRYHRDHRKHRAYYGYYNDHHHGPGSRGWSHRSCCKGCSPFVNGFYFSSTWFEPDAFFSFSTGSRW